MSIDLQGAAITRDAHAALLDLKELVDKAAERIKVAERETIGAAINRQKGTADPLVSLRDAAEKLQSPKLEAAVSKAREKMQHALDFYHEGAKAATA